MVKSNRWVVINKRRFVVGFLIYQHPKSFLKAKAESLIRFGVLKGMLNRKVLPIGEIVFEDYTISMED